MKTMSKKASRVWAQKVIKDLCNEFNCEWYYAFEDLGGSQIMRNIGVHPDVIREWAMEV